jgi:hypothetical protein
LLQFAQLFPKMPCPILKVGQCRQRIFRVMPDAMAIAASGIQTGMTALSQAAANVAAATEPAPAPASGFALGFNPSAPSANLQDLVAMPPVDPATAIIGQIEAANGVRANLVVYRAAAHMYRALLRL